MYQQQPRVDYGPSWADVVARQNVLMGLYEWSCTIELSAPPDGRFGPTRGIWVRCVARRKVGDDGLYSERAAGQLWPAQGYRTMPALLMALLDRLERRLQDTATDMLTGMPLRSYFHPDTRGKNDPS